MYDAVSFMQAGLGRCELQTCFGLNGCDVTVTDILAASCDGGLHACSSGEEHEHVNAVCAYDVVKCVLSKK